MRKLDYKYIVIFLCISSFALLIFMAVEAPVARTMRKQKQMPDQVFRVKLISPCLKDTCTAYIKIPYNKIFFRPKL